MASERTTPRLITGRHAELAAPYLFAIGVTAIWWFVGCQTFPSQPSGLLAASGGASAVLVGFLATAKTVILSLSGAKVFKALKEAGFTKALFGYLYWAIIWGILFLILSVVGFFVTDVATPSWFPVLWVFCGALALSLFVQITNLLFKLLQWV